MTTFKLTLAYDGTNYVGWQRQAIRTSVQGVVEASLRELDGRGPDARADESPGLPDAGA